MPITQAVDAPTTHATIRELAEWRADPAVSVFHPTPATTT